MTLKLRTDELRVLLLDADDNLFPSEEPAFAASAGVTNRFLESVGVQARYSPEALLAIAVGKAFRATVIDLAALEGVDVLGVLTPAELDEWVAEEQKVVSAHLGGVLLPDTAVLGPVRRLASRYPIAAVSSSSLPRLDACFRATGLADLLPPDRRFSAESSLSPPTSKPDPAIYTHAVSQLGVTPREALAIEDSVTGTRSAVAAGIATVGNVMFVEPSARDGRRRELMSAGATAIVESWEQLAQSLLPD